MTGLDFDYVGERDIRNKPLVREVDHSRQRELRRAVLVGIALVFVLLFSAWQHFELLQLGYQIEQTQQQRAREMEINRHLKLEIETLQAPERIERIATEQLAMVEPESDAAIVVERVVPAAAPDRSLRAAR